MNMSVHVCTVMSETCGVGWMAVDSETGGSGKEQSQKHGSLLQSTPQVSHFDPEDRECRALLSEHRSLLIFIPG